MVRKVMIFMPLAKASVDTGFFETYSRAKTYLMSHVDELPWEIEIMEYYAHTFPIDANRNECATRFIEGLPLPGGIVWRADISIWLDTDHELPADSLVRMLKHDKPIILGIYYIKAQDHNRPFYPVIFRRRKDKPNLFQAVMEFPEKELFEVDFAGMGAACIKREVFEALDKPYFKYSLHPEDLLAKDSKWKNISEIYDISEDKHFWDQVKDKTDYTILVDPNIQFGHIGRMVFDKHMYKGWVTQFKEQLLKEHGQEGFDQKWGGMLKVEPYRESKIVKKTG